MTIRCLFALLAALPLAGCLSKNPPMNVRWFLPEVGTFEPAGQADPIPLQISRVSSASYLRESMVWRVSAVEIFFDGQNQWGGDPAELVQDALEDSLFSSSCVPSTASDAARLTADLRTFEGSTAGGARIELAISVKFDSQRQVQRTFAATHPVATRDPDVLARSMGEALHQVAVEISEWVATLR